MRKLLLARATIGPRPMNPALGHAFGWKIWPDARARHVNVFRRSNVLRIGRGARIHHPDAPGGGRMLATLAS
jgi:hypothetical protein